MYIVMCKDVNVILDCTVHTKCCVCLLAKKPSCYLVAPNVESTKQINISYNINQLTGGVKEGLICFCSTDSRLIC